ncbi:Methylated-DNA--protein-cysteine methyltransferase [Candidatus Bilamarchaeum dharawalense]|uniref:Methylated-DNA--protein-cysteine methyltransferase n=1 Tax=Candidatus Bilamarchaeum dharawalense TaxID=2885759 RepID=A0A5E4LNP0_9ARCH|nr:Methylated-DNA--protein-cysteine methyltransferase [Candidatus Bilamarchaeum dharawalense]
MTRFQEKVYAACKKIPRGKISTYSAIAHAIGKPTACRAVGNALNKNRSSDVPCHRVICSNGRVGGFAHGTRAKIKMLTVEGLKIKRGKLLFFKSFFYLP